LVVLWALGLVIFYTLVRAGRHCPHPSERRDALAPIESRSHAV